MDDGHRPRGMTAPDPAITEVDDGNVAGLQDKTNKISQQELKSELVCGLIAAFVCPIFVGGIKTPKEGGKHP